MTSALSIREIDKVIVRDILRAHLPPGAKVWVFGSRALGTNKPAADLDLALDAGRPLTRLEGGALADVFEESDLPYKVDVVDLWTVNESFRTIIEAARTEFEP